MVPERRAASVRDAVALYVHAIPIPALDERAIAARRGTLAVALAPRRPRLRAIALAMAATLAVIVAADASAVVAGMQRVFAAFTVAGGRTSPMSVREVDLATARADVPFAIIPPPALPGITVTLREIGSPAAPASESVAFELQTRRPGPPITIVEARAGGELRHVYLSEREPARGDAKVAPFPAPVQSGSDGRHPSLLGKLGDRSFVPLTWVARGTRIVLLMPPGALTDAHVRAIRSAMSQ
jgi:hypothetical protein